MYHYYEIPFNDVFAFARIIREYKCSKPHPGQVLSLYHPNDSQFDASFAMFFEHDYLDVIREELINALHSRHYRIEQDYLLIQDFLDMFKVMPIPSEEMYADAKDAMHIFWFYQSNLFSPDALSTLFIGFHRNLFTRPKPYEMLKLPYEDKGVILYFEIDYQYKLMQEYYNAKIDGKFKSSNNEKNWLKVLELLESANDEYDNLKDQAEDYSQILNN